MQTPKLVMTCLLDLFLLACAIQSLQSLLTASGMWQVPTAQKSLETNIEEMFDVMACYFPISFTPPPNSVHSITRQDLAGHTAGGP